MATHSSILAWKLLWMKEPGELQSMGSQSRTRLNTQSQHKFKMNPSWLHECLKE